DLPRDRAGSFDAPAWRDITLPDGRPGRLVGVSFVPRDEAPDPSATAPVTLVLAEETSDVRATLATVSRWVWLAGGAARAVIAPVTGWLVSRGLRPLARLAANIDAIDDRRLAERLVVDGQPDELAVPVAKLNELLARLEASFAREKRFTSDVAHELRTPLA